MVAPWDRAVAKYIYNIDTFLCRPWPDGTESGRLLVAAIMERLMRDLLDLFEQVRFVILEPEKAVVRYGGTKIDLTMNLSIDPEFQAFHVWTENTEQLVTLQASVLSDESFYKKLARSSCFSSFLAGFFWVGSSVTTNTLWSRNNGHKFRQVIPP